MRAILGQQVTVAAATTIAGRFAKALGEPVDTPHAGLDRLFPPASRVAAAAPRTSPRSASSPRGRAPSSPSRARCDSGALRLEPSAPVEETLAALERLPGVGPWTAQYIAMRALAWPDAFPHPDVAVLKAMKETDRRAVRLARADAWRPWRAYAVLHLWKSLE